jgi:hypothetical protein
MAQPMSVPIQEAAEALAPLLSAGADAAVRELAGKAGSGLSDAAVRLIGKIRPLLKSSAPDVAEIEQALRAGLADGIVSSLDIEALVSMQSSGRDSLSIRVGNVKAGHDVNIGNTVHERNHEG